jgi:hypothetical protein
MAQKATTKNATNGSQAPLKLDAAVIGARVAGLYQLHLLRNQGLVVKAFDAASDVGHSIIPERTAVPTKPAGVTPYLKALTLVTGLLAVWAGLCAT